jgi:hypothetical protein
MYNSVTKLVIRQTFLCAFSKSQLFEIAWYSRSSCQDGLGRRSDRPEMVLDMLPQTGNQVISWSNRNWVKCYPDGYMLIVSHNMLSINVRVLLTIGEWTIELKHKTTIVQFNSTALNSWYDISHSAHIRQSEQRNCYLGWFGLARALRPIHPDQCFSLVIFHVFPSTNSKSSPCWSCPHTDSP